MASSKPASTSRTGFHIRAKLLSAANTALSSASSLVNNVLDGEDDDGTPKAPKPSLYTDERCLVFPGWAYIRDSELTVGIEGFAFGLRPLESASRTQKLFVSAARQLTSLPNISKTSLTEEPLDMELPPDSLKEEMHKFDQHNKVVQAPTTERTLADTLAATSISSNGAASTSTASLQPVRPPRRRGTGSSFASISSAFSSNTSSTATMKPLAKVTYSNASLHILHENLNTRLRLFFSQKLVGRRIRVSVYLLPQATEAETCVAKGTLVTELGGVFKSSICVPWPGGDSHGRKLRVRTELLQDALDGAEATVDDQRSHDQAMKRCDDAVVALTASSAPIRVISDIDDTIKMTHVLGGMKTVIRNVFTRPHEELQCDGMKDWYWDMYERGACFHFVSNSPFELFGVLREYLQVAGFPPGSMRLKEYGGGNGSLFGGLWEQAGARKRGGLEEILRTFTDSRFILVGDSGEQDLEVYASLARQFPRQILGIFIRDVTTPLPRSGDKFQATSITESQRQNGGDSEHLAPPLPPRPRTVRRKSDAEQAKLLVDLAADDVSHHQDASQFEANVQEVRDSPTLDQSASMEDESDLLSPNNPLRRNSIESGHLMPLDDQGYTEVERRVVNLFNDRVLRAKAELPPNTHLRIFRDGAECKADAVRLMNSSR